MIAKPSSSARRTRRPQDAARLRAAQRRLLFESLEERRVLAAFTPGNLVVYRVGDGAAAPADNVAAQVFLDEYTQAGALVQSVAMPTAVNGANQPLTADGAPQAFEGVLSRSLDGRFLLVPGYAATPGATPLVDAAAATVQRVIGVVDGSGVIDTSTTLGTAATSSLSANAIRNAVSTDGTDIWYTGGLQGASGILGYVERGTSTPAWLQGAPEQSVAVGIFGNQLYSSSLSGGIFTWGTGLPESGPVTVTSILTGISDPGQFVLLDLEPGNPAPDTLYVASDVNGGGILKYYSADGTTWTPKGKLSTGAAGASGLHSVSVLAVSGSSVTLTFSDANKIYVNTDNSGAQGDLGTTNATSVVTAGANMLFRGVAQTPEVPNAPPVVALPGTPGSFVEGGGAVLIDGSATVADDSPNFDGGTLTVSITAGAHANDRLGIRNQGTDPGQIGVSGANVTFGGTTIGTFAGGAGAPLVVTFNAAATPAAAQALLQNIIFDSTNAPAGAATRTVQFVVTDGDGGTSNTAAVNINVTGLAEISVSDAVVTEGNAGTVNLAFTITAIGVTTPVQVNYSTANDTAIAGSDYAAIAGSSFTFNVSGSQVVNVVISGDTTYEPNETLFLNITAPTAVVTDPQGQGTITNDDPQPAISIGDVTQSEGNGGGTTAFTFTISLSNPSYQTVTVSAQSQFGTANAADFAALPLTLVTFNPGETSKTVTVNVNADGTFEGNEDFQVVLSGATNATIADSTGVGTINNDDPQPTISIADLAAQPEGNGGGTTPFVFTVTLSNPSDQTITVQAQPQAGTANAADFASMAASLVTFAPGETSKTVTVNVNADNMYEGNETFTVTLSSPTNATIADGSATGTINNDDPLPTVSVTSVTLNEGNAGTTTYTFSVSLSNPSDQPITVNYSTADDTATTADGDYVATSGTLTFPAGSTTAQTFSVTVNGDNKFENTETFRVNLTTTNAANASLQATGTITNDDTIPSMTITSAVALEEGNSGTTAFNYTVTLSNPTAFAVTVDYNVIDGSATLANNDFLPTSGTLTIPAGSLTGTITVEVVGDDKVELDETFSLVLSNPTNATIASGTGAGTIINDDGIVNAGYLNPALINDGNADTFRLVRNGDNLDLYVNDHPTPVKSFILANTDSLDVQGSSDSDRLIIDYSGGYWRVPLGITYNGNRLGPDAGDNDALEIRGGAGVAFDRETYVVGATQDAGTWTLNPELAVAGDETIIVFNNLEPVDSDVAAVDFEIVMNGAANVATLENGGLLNGFTSLQLTDDNASFETTRFANKTNVSISGMGGSDSFTSNYTTPSDGLATVSFYGHAGPLTVAPPADDNAVDNFFLDSNAAGITLSALGQGGDDFFVLGTVGGVLAGLNGDIVLTGGEVGETIGDRIRVQDFGATAASNATLTSTQLTGAAPGVIAYSEAEDFFFDSADFQNTNLAVLSTAAGTTYLVELTFGAAIANVVVGTSGAVNAGAGTLDNIAGPLTFEFNDGNSRLQIDDSGDATGDNITISRDATHTTIAGASPATIRYAISGGNGLQEFELYTGSGADTINVQTTTASVSSLINSNGGSDTFNITGNDLSADNRFLGGDGQDVFNATFANPGAPLFATTLVEFDGGNVDNTDNRDRLNLNDTAAAGRALTFAYGAGGADLSITTGFTFPINLLRTETLVYNSTGGADTVAVVGTAADDDLTIVPRSPSEALIFNGGDPFDGPPETITGNLPGVAGGGIGPDIRMIGLVGDINVAGGGSVTGDQLYVYARNEQSIVDPGTADDIFGLGAGVLIPGVGVGNAYDSIWTDGTSVNITGLATVTLAPGSFTQNDPQRPGLIINGGDEAAPDANGQADQFVVSPSLAFAIHVNGGNPLPSFAPNGDSLFVTAIGDLNVYSDKASPPNVSILSSYSPFEVTFSSIERTLLVPSTGVVNLIGDNNNTTPQTDNFVVVGTDIDQVFNPLFPPADGGVGEFTLQINGSAPIFFDNVQFLNVVGHQLVDTLEITAYADNTPRGWGIDVFYDEGLPTQSDGGQLDLLIYNTSVNAGDVSEDIVIQPSGPENGELRVTNGAFGTPIVVVSFVNNLDIIVNDNDGDLPDTDTLTLRGTNPDAVQTSGNELFDADFTRAGDVANPLVVVSDLDPLNVGAPLLYRLRNFTGFGSINFATLGGTDEIQITNRAGLTVNVDGGVPVTEDVLNVVVPTSAIIRQGVDASTGEIITPDAGTIHFQNVSQINITSAAAGSTLTVDGTDSDDAITIAAGAVPGEGTVTINGGPVIGFNAAGTNFTTLVVNGRAGDDHYQLAPIAGVAQTIAAGSGQDTAQVTGTAAAENFTFTPTAADAATLATVGFGLVTFTGSEAIALNGNGGGDTINLIGTAADDSFAFDPATTNSGSFTSTLSPALTFESYASASITGGAGGFDQVALTGTNGDDTVTSTATTLTLGATTITFSAIDHIDIATLSGVDVLNLLALAGVTFSVDGGDPANSDVLNVTVPTSATIRQGVDASSGEIVMPDAGTITFKNVSQINITSATAGSTLTVEGTSDVDTIEVGATGMVTVNDGPAISIGANFGTLAVNGLAGDDAITINPLVGVAINVAGGGTSGDHVTFLGTAGADAITFTPGSDDDATIAVVGFGLTTLVDVESVSIDGQGGGDTLTVNGTAADDTFHVQPTGAGTGSLVSSQSPVLDFRSFTTLNVNGGAGGIDEVAITGTAGADAVTSTANSIILGSTIVFGAGIDHLELSTLGGDDNINLLAFTAVVASAGLPATTIFGGDGNDTIIGTNSIDLIYGGSGNDVLIGAGGNDTIYGEDGDDRFGDPAAADSAANDGGNDTFFGGAGSDTLVWDPGDGSDIFEGGEGIDVLIFNGSGAAETFTIATTVNATTNTPSPGARLLLQRDVGGINMNMAGVEQIDLHANAGADRVNVQDVASTDLAHLNINLGADAVDDIVTVHGRNVADNITATAAGGIVSVVGLEYDIAISGSTAPPDQLVIEGHEGNDTIIAAPGVEDLIGLTLSGGAGNDFLSGDGTLIGGAGDDILIGGDLGNLLQGGDGNDFLVGNAGDDTLEGGAGDDVLVGGTGNDTLNGGTGYDSILIEGTSATDTIDVFQSALTANTTTLTYTVNGVTENDTILLVAAGGNTSVEQAIIEAGAGADLIRVNWRDNTGVNFGVDAATGNSLRYTVRGGDDQTSDRLLVVDDGIDDLTIYRKAESDSAGTVSIGPANSEALQTVFSGIEHVQFLTTSDTGVYPVAPVAPNTAGTNSRLVVFKHDPFEYNNDRTVATHIGVGQSLNVDPTIDPAGVTNPFGDGTDIPGDSDWYRVEALVSGTLDFQVFFDQIASVGARPGLPGAGDIDIEVYDSTGDLIANFGANNGGSELDPDGDNERIRIPAVQGQTYYLRVYGRTAPVVNNYNISVINLAPPTPYDIELDDVLGQGTVNAVVANGFSANNLAAPNLPLSTVDDYYNGKYLTFTSGALAGQRALVADYVGATRTFTFAAGAFNGAIPAGATFQVESVDTGRSQFDNTTKDTTPTIILRLDDGILLNDLPGNSTPGLPPDQVITIPFQGTTLAPGYRIAIFDEGDGLAPNTDAPQVPVGYATATADPGVYTFTFTTPLTPGSHFISARVQMIDPANPQQTGFGPRSVSMEIVVDPVAPSVAFGEIAVANDGLHPDSDSGVLVNPSTYDDRITNDETPTFWGVAEANSVIRVYVDQNGNGVVDAGDVLIAQTVATPLDGTNQFPGGRWEATSTINLNDEDLFPVDGLRTILVTAEDLAGNVGAPASLEIFLDTQAPVITGVEITGIPGFDLFAPKPATQGPTPLVDSLTIKVSDLPARIAQFLYDALDEKVAETPGHYVLVGDFSGIIPIDEVDFIPDPLVPGQPATGEIIIKFFKPLPDDRFTLTISDELVDPAGNNLDGESDGVEPDGSPSFPTGDGQPGGDFVVRFTVDSRAEVGSWASSSVWVDHNGNGYHDPASPVDFTNRDITYALGYTPDTMFAGNFAANGLAADGFDKIASYGPVGGVYRFLVDFDNDGVPDPLPAVGPGLTVLNINGLPVAGNFDGNAVNGDEVGVFAGDRWYFDTNRNFVIDSGDLVRMTGLRGYPVVGDFDNDGFDDLATFQNDHFYFDLTNGAANGWNGVADFDVRFGFAGVRERPVAGDMDGDGIDDIGLWVPDRVAPQPTSEWYIIVSGGSPIVKTGLPQNSPGHRVDRDLVDGKNIFNFSPTPFNNDLYLSFGDEFAQPILGNFDPPLESNPAAVTGVFTNPRNALDVNDDGMISPLDALLVINQLNAQGARPMTSSLRSDAGPFYDVNNDQQVTPLDALTLIIYLNSHGTGPAASGEDTSSQSFVAATTSTQESSSLETSTSPAASSLPFGSLDSGSSAANSSTVETGDEGLLAYLAEPSVAPTTFDPQVIDNAGPNYGSGDGNSDELSDVLDSFAGELAELWN